MTAAGKRYLDARAQTVDWLSRRLARSSPSATVARQRDWLQNLRQVMIAAIRHDLASRGRVLANSRTRLLQRSPAVSVARSISRMQALQARLENGARRAVDRRRQQLTLAARALDSVSPLATLDRGYAIVTAKDSGRVLTDAAAAPVGSSIRARLANGTLEATVTAQLDADEKKA